MATTSKNLFFAGKSTNIYILEGINCILAETKGFQTSPVYREQAEKQIEAFRTYGAHGIIWDLQEAGVITPEDQQWTLEDWQPRAIEAGYRRGAIVIPENIFGELSVINVISKIDQHNDLSVQYFNSTANAIRWMDEELKN
jgi:hypothetical protein